MTVFTPERAAAKTFDLIPPTGRIFPRNVISPVIASDGFNGLCINNDASAIAMVRPADGPSFGIAPAGTWMWMSDFSKIFGSMPSCCARDRT